MHSKTAHDPMNSYLSSKHKAIHFIIHHNLFFPSSTTFGTAGTSTSISHFIPT